jgi:glycosyltransferase involved in cell wall biosynthesis
MDYFEADPYPGHTKILFIGLGVSTHTHSWIDLLSDSKLNVRLFSIPGGGIPPRDWQVRTYICTPADQLSAGIDQSIRQTLYPLPEESEAIGKEYEKSILNLEKAPVFRVSTFLKDMINLGTRWGVPPLLYDYSQLEVYKKSFQNRWKAASAQEWLAQIIRAWQPDIIHTLGLFDGQGGTFYYEVRQQFGLEGMGTWVLQLRGGSDLALRQHHPETARQIQDMFNECDEILTDNYVNIDYIKRLGLGHKIAAIAPVPGTGGVDTPQNTEEIVLPSRKERIVLWPKAYESPWSKALPVLEAIKLAWHDIQPCTIYMTASMPETEAWFYAMMPRDIQENCILIERLPREDLLALMKRARVLLIPSLVDGVPNSLYEAMANGVFPIVSPLATITPLVKENENALFARNLYPVEIREALVKAMSDDVLVDRAAANNLHQVTQIASRKQIAKQVIEYYRHLS